MRIKNILLLLVFVIFISACKTLKKVDQSNNNEYFNIEVIQNGKIVKQKNDIILLEKKPFKYKITLIKVKDVFVSSSWGKYYYDYPIEKNIFQCDDAESYKGCRFVSIKTGAEDKFNVNKDIYVGDGDYQQVWFYSDRVNWHRMDSVVTVKNGIINATVTVENILDLDKRDERKYEEATYNYPIEKVSEDIYVVFATNHYAKGMKYPKELQREKIILKFK